jgi:hypothetical protein
MSTASQKKAIKEMRNVCGATEKVAADLLKKYNYNVEQALDHFYTHGGSTDGDTSKKGGGDKGKVSKIFDKYADPKDKDSMSGEPLGQFFRDAGVDPEKEGAVTLAAAYKLKCKVLGEIRRTEFVDGFTATGSDTIDKIKGEMNGTREMLKDKQRFRDFYRWLFDFIKEEPDRKSVDLEPAVEFLKCVLPPHFTLCNEFLEFLKAQKLKSVSSDVWNQLWEFARDIKSDLSNYEVDGAWPVLFDDFVAFVNDQKKKAAGGDSKSNKK